MTEIRVLESNDYIEHFQVIDDDGNVIDQVLGTQDGPPFTQAEKEFRWMLGEIGFRGAKTFTEARKRVKKNLAADPNYYDQFDWP